MIQVKNHRKYSQYFNQFNFKTISDSMKLFFCCRVSSLFFFLVSVVLMMWQIHYLLNHFRNGLAMIYFNSLISVIIHVHNEYLMTFGKKSFAFKCIQILLRFYKQKLIRLCLFYFFSFERLTQ